MFEAIVITLAVFAGAVAGFVAGWMWEPPFKEVNEDERGGRREVPIEQE